MLALGAAPTLAPYADVDGFLTVGFESVRDVDAAMPRAAVVVVVVLTPLEILVGAGSRREGASAACSASVFRCLKAGSGTEMVSGLSGSMGIGRGNVQPEGLCLAVGMGIALRALVPDSCNSPRARGGDDVMWEKVDGGLIPERFVIA